MVLLQLDYLSPIANIEEYILFMTTFPRRDQGTPEGGKIFYKTGHIRSMQLFEAVPSPCQSASFPMFSSFPLLPSGFPWFSFFER